MAKEYDPAAEPLPANKEGAENGFKKLENASTAEERAKAVDDIINASLENNPK